MAEMQTIQFTRGVPANESYPIEEIAAAAADAIRRYGAAMMAYGPALGFGPLREWLAGWQGVKPDEVLTANGSLQIVEFVCLALLRPGDVVFTEAPTYDRTITMLRRHGAEIVGIPLEADGPNVDALEQELARRSPKFFYTIPDFQNPAGATCSAEKRRRVVELARRHGFLILEDAPYRLLRYRGADEPTIHSLAPELTIHMSSFTKLIAPGVRVGFAIGDSGTLKRLAKAAEDTYISPGYVAHGITFEWCRRGLLEPQIARLKELYAPRLEACRGALDRHIPDAVATRPDGGFFLSLTLPEGVGTTAVRTAAAKRELVLADGLAFFPEGGGERFLRLPFCALTPAEIEEGVRRLAEAIREVRATA
jgi:2-aminoadipate transaminase